MLYLNMRIRIQKKTYLQTLSRIQQNIPARELANPNERETFDRCRKQAVRECLLELGYQDPESIIPFVQISKEA